jgi:hypothetical protein
MTTNHSCHCEERSSSSGVSRMYLCTSEPRERASVRASPAGNLTPTAAPLIAPRIAAVVVDVAPDLIALLRRDLFPPRTLLLLAARLALALRRFARRVVVARTAIAVRRRREGGGQAAANADQDGQTFHAVLVVIDIDRVGRQSAFYYRRGGLTSCASLASRRMLRAASPCSRRNSANSRSVTRPSER